MDGQKTVETAGGKWTWSAGAKARLREADNDLDRSPFGPEGTPFTLEDFVRNGPSAVYNETYAIGPMGDPQRLAARREASPEQFRFDALNAESGSATSDYDVSESIYASYAMVRREWKEWTVIAGARP